MSLEEAFPKLSAEWHPKKNGELTAGDVLPSSNKRVWWRCRRDRELARGEWAA